MPSLVLVAPWPLPFVGALVDPLVSLCFQWILVVSVWIVDWGEPVVVPPACVVGAVGAGPCGLSSV